MIHEAEGENQFREDVSHFGVGVERVEQTKARTTKCGTSEERRNRNERTVKSLSGSDGTQKADFVWADRFKSTDQMSQMICCK